MSAHDGDALDGSSRPATVHRPLFSRTRGLLPFGLVLLSLLSLAALHLFANYETERLRRRVTEVLEPSRALVSEIRAATALEAASARGYLLGDDARSAAIRADAKRERAIALSRLLPLIETLGPDARTRTDELSATLRSADLVFDSLFSGHISSRDYSAELDRAEERAVTASNRAADLGKVIAADVAQRQSNVRAIQRTSALLTTVLVLLALVAAFLVERLGKGYRSVLEELSGSEERFRQIVEAIHDFIWLSDARFTKHLYANAAYEQIWGRSRERLYENAYALVDGVHADDVARVSDALRRLPGGEYDIEFRVVRPDGEQRWVWSRGFPVRNDRGVIYRIAGISEDITDRKVAESERDLLLQREKQARSASEEARAAAEARRAELERVTASRARLIRGFSHDVKNPLGAADGFLALLEDGILGGLEPKQQESVRRARRSIGAALALIGYLLDLARAEAGQLEIHEAMFDLAALAKEVSEDFRAAAESKQQTIELTDAAAEPLTICSDHDRARQVLANLVSNAVKYTGRGGQIRICAKSGVRPATEKGEWLAIDVADDGPGIAPEHQPRLFDEFARFDPTAAEGSGIGLAISQRIASALNGAITVVSEVGVGSTFTFWLPANKSSDETRSAVSEQREDGVAPERGRPREMIGKR